MNFNFFSNNLIQKYQIIIKINENGIPVMQPLQEELPKLSKSFFEDKKYGASRFFEKTWSEKNDNVSFLVAKNGKILFEDYEGFAYKEKNDKNGKNKPIHIASVSKVLTAAVILRMVDQEKIGLDEHLSPTRKNGLSSLISSIKNAAKLKLI